MAEIIEIDGQDLTPMIKNTFIDWPRHAQSSKRRNKSLPPSFRPDVFVTCRTPPRSQCATPELVKLPVFSHFDSDDSTDMRTEVSDDHISEMEHASSYAASSTHEVWAPSCEPCMAYGNQEQQLWAPSPVASIASTPTFLNAAPKTPLSSTSTAFQPGLQRLSSKAVAFQPLKSALDHDDQIAEALEATRKIVEECSGVASVDVAQQTDCWSLVVTPDAKSQVSTERTLQAVKNALMVAAEQSKNVYVLGYCKTSDAFKDSPRGFDAQLAVMESMERACWQKLKQGSCRHEGDCYRQHPVLEVPVQVSLELTQMNAPKQTVQMFKQELATIMTTIIAMLNTAACGAGSQFFLDEDENGCRLEIYAPAEDIKSLKDHYLGIAKNAFAQVTQQSQIVYIMGMSTATAGFTTKSSGFVMTLGEMMDQSKACWDIYTQGTCWREQSCRWRHPQCLLPVNVVLKSL